jgi:hypothetical protein
MSTPEDNGSEHGEHGEDGGGHSHWTMVACCVPMIAIAIALVATGVVGAGFLLVAVGCLLMMALMMGAIMGRS